MPFKILLADDNEDFTLLFKQALAKIAPDSMCLATENGHQALSQLRFMLPNAPDLIFIDVKMPIMDGYEILRQIKAIPELVDVPIIMYSAVSMDTNVEGIDNFFLKPNTGDELNLMIRESLKGWLGNK